MKTVKITLVLLLSLSTQVVALSQERGKITKERGEFIETIDKTYKVKKGGSLFLSSDQGPIYVETWFEDKVRVVVIKRADVRNESRAEEIFEEIEVTITKSGKDVTVKARTPWRRRRRSSVLSFEITVPYKYNVDVETDGGSIRIADLEGNLTADTEGGSIKVGQIKNGDVRVETAGGSIKIVGIKNGNGIASTAGGSIKVGDVSGDLKVHTSGGSIELGIIGGKAKAHTSGGSIKVKEGGIDLDASTSGGSISVNYANGPVKVRTSGGSISIGDTKGDIDASTAGGSIHIGESGGRVNASTAGGGISVEGSQGPVIVETAGGSIEITNARGFIEAVTAGGDVEAELIVSDKNIDTHVTLETAGGDITLYLPAELSATFDVELEITRRAWRDYKIYSDFPLSISDDADGWRGNKIIIAEGDINGGGDKIKIRTKNGDIRIKKIR
ncbi:MAG: DUF4097 family beta strand repeat protein [Candidatus Marinimicrobia bacterium]|nr:DUF4097 family beta strand repeat protein [Candidatus Neomarinimicrobiota bacterium]